MKIDNQKNLLENKMYTYGGVFNALPGAIGLPWDSSKFLSLIPGHVLF